jgi:hypothetical protein
MGSKGITALVGYAAFYMVQNRGSEVLAVAQVLKRAIRC